MQTQDSAIELQAVELYGRWGTWFMTLNTTGAASAASNFTVDVEVAEGGCPGQPACSGSGQCLRNERRDWFCRCDPDRFGHACEVRVMARPHAACMSVCAGGLAPCEGRASSVQIDTEHLHGGVHAELSQQLLLPLDAVLSGAPPDESVHIAYKPPLATPTASQEELAEVYADLFGVGMCSAVSVQPWDGTYAGRAPGADALPTSRPDSEDHSPDGDEDRHFAFERPAATLDENDEDAPHADGAAAAGGNVADRDPDDRGQPSTPPPTGSADRNGTSPGGGDDMGSGAMSQSHTSDQSGSKSPDASTPAGDSAPAAPAQPPRREATSAADERVGPLGPSDPNNGGADSATLPPNGGPDNAETADAGTSDRDAGSADGKGIDFDDKSGEEDDFDARDYEEAPAGPDAPDDASAKRAGGSNNARGAASGRPSGGDGPLRPSADGSPVLLLLPGAFHRALASTHDRLLLWAPTRHGVAWSSSVATRSVQAHSEAALCPNMRRACVDMLLLPHRSRRGRASGRSAAGIPHSKWQLRRRRRRRRHDGTGARLRPRRGGGAPGGGHGRGRGRAVLCD